MLTRGSSRFKTIFQGVEVRYQQTRVHGAHANLTSSSLPSVAEKSKGSPFLACPVLHGIALAEVSEWYKK